MSSIEITDFKGDHWQILWPGVISCYLYKGCAYYKAWWYVTEGPDELKNYNEVPLPIFTEWWPR